MRLPQLTFLSPELIDEIVAEGIAILADPGVRVHNAAALTLLAEGGAQVDFQSQVARIPEQLIRECLASVPQAFTLYTLDGKAAVQYGGDAVHFDPGSAAVSILDTATGEQRSPTTADFVRFVKLVETLPELDAQSTAFVCRDVPEGIGDLYRLYLALRYMRKPIITGAFDKHTWWVMYEMLVAAAGSQAALREHPIAVFDVCPSPPLLWSDITCQSLMDSARMGVPAELISMPLAGAAAPVTLAGSVVQHTAESLSGVVIHQLAQAGSPLVWGGAPAVFDMREGTTPMGDPGSWLIDCAYVEVGKRLNIPTHTYMGSTDAKLLDFQAGMESMGGALLAALAGVNMVSGAGMIDFLRCQSFEKLVLDAEIIAAVKRVRRGVEAHEHPLALEVIRQTGHKSGYLSAGHTHRWFRKELHAPSEVIDRGSLEAWQKKGSLSAAERAQLRIEKLLPTYHPSPLTAETHRELERITLAAAQACGMDKLPELPGD